MSRRVALFLPSLAGGGAERIFLVLADAFAARGLEVDLVLADETGPLRAEVPAGVRVVNLRRRRVMTAVRPLAGYLRAARPAGMVTALTHANLVALAATRLVRSDTNVVVTEHNNLTATQRNSSKWQDRLFPTLMRTLYRRADAVVAVSHGMADDIAERAGLPRDSMDVVYNPLRFDAIRRRAAEAPSPGTVPPGDGPLIVGVGSLTAQKDFGNLIAAVDRIRRQTPCRAVVAGEGPERAALERLVAERGLGDVVSLPGFVTNPYPLFAAADVFVLSSRWEGLPTVLLEALSLGTAVVSTDCPDGPREILRGGELGDLVPTEDPDALADAVIHTLGNGRLPQFDESPYSVDAAADRYLQLLGVTGDGR